MSQQISISSVTPVFKGAPYLRDLVKRMGELRKSMDQLNVPLAFHEAIFVVDDAPDHSHEILQDLASTHNWIRVITLSRNFGQHPATLAGIMHTSSDWVVTLDEDLQHDPNHIIDLLKIAIKKQADLIYGLPEQSPHASWYRNLGSKVIKLSIAWASGNENVKKFNSFRLIRGTIARAAASLAGHGAYLDFALSWITTRVSTLQLPMTDPRASRESGYSLARLFRHANSMVMSSDVPVIKWLGAFAFISIVLAAVGFVAMIFLRLAAPETIAVQGWASLIVTILFYGGTTVLVGSVILAFVVGIYQHVLGKPVFYIVDRSGDSVLHALVSENVVD